MTTYKTYEIHPTPDGKYNVVCPNGKFLRPLGIYSLRDAKIYINSEIDHDAYREMDTE